MQRCTICSEWYAGVGIGRLETCEGCLPNFSGNPLEGGTAVDGAAHVPASPTARAALAAFVDSPHALTPRQVQAMTRLAEAWRRQEED